jgi:uncharacterized protein YecE (DUF72 family)
LQTTGSKETTSNWLQISATELRHAMKTISAQSVHDEPCLRIGTAGWSIPRQQALAFPGGGSHLERYGDVLNCVEINSSFYRLPRTATWNKWAAAVPEDFRFSVKAPKSITHAAKLACTSEQMKVFLQEIGNLGTALGPILFQLPPSLAFDASVAKSFLDMLRSQHSGQVALEPRHPSWFEGEPDQLLNHYDIARVAADPVPAKAASIAAAAVPGGSKRLNYYRLHGSPRVYYSEYGRERLTAYAAAITAAATETWCIFDNTASGAATEDALILRALLD